MTPYVRANESGEIVDTGVVATETDLPEGFIVGVGHRLTHYVSGTELQEYTGEQRATKAQKVPGHKWSNVTMSWVSSETLGQARARKWEWAKSERERLELSPITVGAHTYDADQKSQSKIAGAVQMAVLVGGTFSVDWTLSDNSAVTLGQSDVISLGLAVGARTAGLWATSRTLRTAIETATTIAEVDAITWPSE